jgi:hypothetical protein
MPDDGYFCCVPEAEPGPSSQGWPSREEFREASGLEKVLLLEEAVGSDAQPLCKGAFSFFMHFCPTTVDS